MPQSASKQLPFSVMTKPAGAACNLDCSYCFYLEKDKLYKSTRRPVLQDEVLDRYIRSYIASQNTEEVTFTWQGGEPTLLGLDYFENVVALQRKHGGSRTISNVFQTNGVLLDADWAQFFHANDFLLGISIDGPEDMHDAYRVNKGGRGSFKQVMDAIELLHRHKVRFNTLTVLHDDNASDPLRLYRFLKETGSGHLQFIPIVERLSKEASIDELALVKPTFKGNASVTPWSVTPHVYGSFLNTVFDEWVRKDVGRVFVQMFESTLSIWAGLGAGLCIFDKTCGRALAMEHNGDVYSCDHYVYAENLIGNIVDTPLEEIATSLKQQAFGLDKLEGLPQDCLECPVRAACNGGCPKHRFAPAADGSIDLNYLCAGYKSFFTHSAPYMRIMADQVRRGQPVPNVMAWAREKDNGFPSYNVGLNRPCPCGSGQQFRKCCKRP